MKYRLMLSRESMPFSCLYSTTVATHFCPSVCQGMGLSEEHLVRLAVARALVTKPAVLTIDDTFSATEQAAEEQLREAIRSALTEQTVMIATSRLSICEDADLVVVMQRGDVVGQGTHDELISVPGVYRRMYLRQMGMDDPLPGAAQ